MSVFGWITAGIAVVVIGGALWLALPRERGR